MATSITNVVRRNFPPTPLGDQASASAPPLSPGGTAPCSVGFVLFLLLNAVLFIRPAEIVPALIGLPIYEVVILACVIFSFPAILQRFHPRDLANQPITLCVLGLLVAVALSHLSHLAFSMAYEAAFEFAKVIAYYVLLVSLVTSLSRLRTFLLWLTFFVIVLTAVALLEYHGWIDIPALATFEQVQVDEETGEMSVLPRLCSTGIYNDPNDLCLILLVGMAISLYWLGDRTSGPLRLAWLAPLGMFGYALALTQSRGGFLALLGGALVLLWTRFGWAKTLLLALVILPVLLLLFAGRQTSVDLSNPEDTAQARIQLWREGLELFKEAPAFGIGKGEYAERVAYVAHNSFIHCYTDLGFFGGTLFTGVFFLAVWSLRRVGAAPPGELAADVVRLRPYLLTAVAAYVLGILSLSRPYIAPTYMVPGLAAAYVALPAVADRVALPRLTPRLLGVLAGVGLATLATLYIFVRLFAR